MTRFLTPAQAADALAISLKTIYRLIHNGQIRAVKIGRQLRIPAAELTRLEREVQHVVADEPIRVLELSKKIPKKGGRTK
ncbi:MAG: hypothetical protein DRG55_05755 [Deltaproteobacteria bacterium]|nr:MAG: hypothetical protein DRG55_05755 [Deltaproteobacteria bacterium]